MDLALARNRIGSVLRRIAREPFVHFVFLGAATFAIHAALAPGDERRIDVTRSDIEHLRAASIRQWGRDPGPSQMRVLVNGYVREEVLYREALAEGLDKDDVVIRRRLAQKMEFLAQSSVAEPTEAELRGYFRAHADRYARERTFEEAHDRVAIDLVGEREMAAREAAFEALRRRYDVRIASEAARVAAAQP